MTANRQWPQAALRLTTQGPPCLQQVREVPERQAPLLLPLGKKSDTWEMRKGIKSKQLGLGLVTNALFQTPVLPL